MYEHQATTAKRIFIYQINLIQIIKSLQWFIGYNM